MLHVPVAVGPDRTRRQLSTFSAGALTLKASQWFVADAKANIAIFRCVVAVQAHPSSAGTVTTASLPFTTRILSGTCPLSADNGELSATATGARRAQTPLRSKNEMQTAKCTASAAGWQRARAASLRAPGGCNRRRTIDSQPSATRSCTSSPVAHRHIDDSRNVDTRKTPLSKSCRFAQGGKTSSGGGCCCVLRAHDTRTHLALAPAESDALPELSREQRRQCAPLRGER